VRGEGETAFAAESPEFDATRLTLNAWPTLTGWDGTEKEAESAAGVCTVTAAEVAVADVTELPLVASTPLAAPPKVTLPGALPVYPKTNAWVP